MGESDELWMSQKALHVSYPLLIAAGLVGGSGCGRTDSAGQADTYVDSDDRREADERSREDGVIQVSAGYGHTCVLIAGGRVRCWGWGNNGELGYGNTEYIGDDETPASAGDVEVGGTVVQVSAGMDHTCALLDSGAIRCWGQGRNGQLGYASVRSIGDDETPASAGDVDLGGRAIQVSAGKYHTCALLEGGTVRCWGGSHEGQLGYGNTEIIGDDEAPSSAGDVDVGGRVVQIAAGHKHTCALLDGGSLRCWGSRDFGQLGYGNREAIGDDETPASAGDVDVGGPVIQVAAGGNHTCAIIETGTVRCWGYGAFGRLGYGNVESIGHDETPASIGDVEVGGTVVQISAGHHQTCSLLATGAVRCWGMGLNGRLGYGNLEDIGDDEVPAAAGDVDVGGAVVHVSTDGAHTCALLDTGSLRCWGYSGENGHPGLGNIGDDETPASAGDVPVL